MHPKALYEFSRLFIRAQRQHWRCLLSSANASCGCLATCRQQPFATLTDFYFRLRLPCRGANLFRLNYDCRKVVLSVSELVVDLNCYCP